jgi:hypothetical protein
MPIADAVNHFARLGLMRVGIPKSTPATSVEQILANFGLWQKLS